MKQVTGKDKPFGGIPVMFVGDFSQLPPVGSVSIARSIVELKIADEKYKTCARRLRNKTGRSDVGGKKTGKYNDASLFCEGCNLLASCCWIELTEQQ